MIPFHHLAMVLTKFLCWAQMVYSFCIFAVALSGAYVEFSALLTGLPLVESFPTAKTGSIWLGPIQLSMMLTVLLFRNDLEIAGSIIPLLLVLMVDNFILCRKSSCRFPNHKMMFVAISTAVFHTGIVVRRDY